MLSFFGLREWHTHGQASDLGQEPRFSYLQFHMLSTRLLYLSAWPTIAVAFSTCYILDLIVIFWQPGTPQKTEDPVIAGGTLGVGFPLTGEQSITSLLEEKEKRTEESILDWKRTMYTIYTEINPVF